MIQRDHLADIGVQFDLAGLETQQHGGCDKGQQNQGPNSEQPTGNTFGNAT